MRPHDGDWGTQPGATTRPVLTPKIIADALAQKPDVVVDILHSPVARTIADNAKCRYVQLINFPGVEKTTSLEDVFEYNTNQLLKAFHSKS